MWKGSKFQKVRIPKKLKYTDRSKIWTNWNPEKLESQIVKNTKKSKSQICQNPEWDDISDFGYSGFWSLQDWGFWDFDLWNFDSLKFLTDTKDISKFIKN